MELLPLLPQHIVPISPTAQVFQPSHQVSGTLCPKDRATDHRSLQHHPHDQFFISSVLNRSCDQHEHHATLSHCPTSQEHIRRCELHRRNSAGLGPAGRHLLPLQVLQVQGPQLPHPLRHLHSWVLHLSTLSHYKPQPTGEDFPLGTHSSQQTQTVF